MSMFRSVSALFVCLPLLAPAFDALADEAPGVLPASLAQWYKPQNKRQVWLHTMFGMRRELQAVLEYAEAGDVERLKKWSDRLTKHYRRIPEMVPEWSDEVETGAADRLDQAAEDGDLSAAVQTAKQLGRSCRSCHREFRALAAARFRSPDFSAIRVGDMSHSDAMKALTRSVNSIKIAADDDLWEKATDAAETLRGQLSELKTSCQSCHKDKQPAERILGADTAMELERLTQHLAAKDLKRSGRSLGTAAVIVCARCHGVHRTLYDLRGHLFD